ncbi:MAG: hypothetical protein ACXQS8_06665 [Candidatus Helarchaeales archaeon]
MELETYLKKTKKTPIVRYWIDEIEFIPKWVEEGKDLPEFLEVDETGWSNVW